MYIIGIDPGTHGALSVVNLTGDKREVYAFSKHTDHDLRIILEDLAALYDCRAYLEEVHAMPRDGKVQAFNFGNNFGFWRGLLTGLKIPYESVIPLKWQNGLKLKLRKLEYRQKKNALKGYAQQWFPDLKPTLDTCDALLIAEYGRRSILEQKRLARL